MPYAYPPIKITGNYNSENQRNIINDGNIIRWKMKKILDSGIYGYVEKYNRVWCK